jgi:hypothetical protein
VYARFDCEGLQGNGGVGVLSYAFDQILRMPFKVYKCSGHADKGMPTWEQMKDMAIEVKPISNAKQAGFYYPEDVSIDVPVEASTMED